MVCARCTRCARGWCDFPPPASFCCRSQLGLGGDEDEVYLPRELALTRFDDSGKVQVLQIDAGAQHSVAIVKVAK